MKLAESFLYALTKRLSQRNMGQSQERTEALADDDAYADYRAKYVEMVLDAARQYKVEWQDRDVLDLGCNDGAVSRGYLAGQLIYCHLHNRSRICERTKNQPSNSRPIVMHTCMKLPA